MEPQAFKLNESFFICFSIISPIEEKVPLLSMNESECFATTIDTKLLIMSRIIPQMWQYFTKIL